MDRIQKNQPIVSTCDQLKMQINCDFVGLALQDQEGPDVRWHYAIGNNTDKYKRISLRYGKGIAGKVISTGRPMTIDRFPDQIIGKAIEYPIMLAENLVSSYAVPIFHNGTPKGVLLLGHRCPHSYTEDEQKEAKETAIVLEGLLNDHLS